MDKQTRYSLIIKFCLIIFLAAWLYPAQLSLAQNKTQQENNIARQRPELRIGFGLERPPFIYNDPKEGLEIDLIKAITTEMGYNIIPYYLPNTRGYTVLKNKNIDLYTIASQNIAEEFYLSDSYMVFDNVLISKGENHPQIKNLSQIRDKRLAAFQGAHLFIKEINDIRNDLSIYIETPRQSTQIQLLYKERVDYVFSEKKVFEFYFKRAIKNRNLPASGFKYEIHHILPPTLYSAAFNKAELRDEFNTALQTIKRNGIYANIMQKYDQNFKEHKTGAPN